MKSTFDQSSYFNKWTQHLIQNSTSNTNLTNDTLQRQLTTVDELLFVFVESSDKLECKL